LENLKVRFAASGNMSLQVSSSSGTINWYKHKNELENYWNSWSWLFKQLHFNRTIILVKNRATRV
jgi:hypothetical protein